MVNLAAITGSLESPCKKCSNVNEDKEICSIGCKTIKNFQRFLGDYSMLFAGKIIDVEDAYPIQYWGYEDSTNIDKINNETKSLIPIGINMSKKTTVPSV